MKGHNKGILAIWGILIVLSAVYLVTSVHMSSQMSDLLPVAKNSTQKMVIDQIRNGPSSQLLLLGIEGPLPTELTRLSKRLSAWMKASPHFQFIANGEQTGTEKEHELLFEYRYLLSPALDTSHFEVEGLRHELTARMQEMVSPLSSVVKSSLPVDPTGAFRAIHQSWGTGVHRHLSDGVWMDQSGRRGSAHRKNESFRI